MGKSDRSQSQRNLVALIVVAMLACLAAGSPAAHAADPDVDELFQRMQKAMWPGKDMRARFEARVVSALGEHAYITGSYYRRGETPKPTLQRFIIDSPIALQGFELTGTSDGGKPMDLHIYVPAVRRVRRIHLDMRKESFLATDFNFEDLGFEDVAIGKSVVRQVEHGGRPAYRIETTLDGDWLYEKIVRVLDRASFLPVRTEYHCWGVGLCKVRTIDRVDTIDGYASPAVITMEDVINQQKTELLVRDAEFDVGLPVDLFNCHAPVAQ